MRLTPFRTYSSSPARDESTTCADTPLDGERPSEAPATGVKVDGVGHDAIEAENRMETDVDVVATLDELETPVTVDEIADRLVSNESCDIETWGDVHERLYHGELPALDEAGVVTFDAEQGTVDVPSDEGMLEAVRSSTSVKRAVLAAVSLGFLSVPLFVQLPSLASMLSVSFAAVGLVEYVRIR